VDLLGRSMTTKVIKTTARGQGEGKNKILKGNRFIVWVVESIIVVLIAFNAYLVYSLTSSSSYNFFDSKLASVESGVDPSNFKIQVEVLNGCGEKGIGQKVMKFLRNRGFDVVNIDNANHFEYNETIVLDRKGSNGPSTDAFKVGVALGSPNVILQENTVRMVDVSVIVGKDYNRLLFYKEQN